MAADQRLCDVGRRAVKEFPRSEMIACAGLLTSRRETADGIGHEAWSFRPSRMLRRRTWRWQEHGEKATRRDSKKGGRQV